MEKEIAEKVIEKLSQKITASGKFVQFNDSSYSPVEFDRNNFRQINESGGNAKIAFIDGGNNTIIDSASFCLQAARVYYTIYSGSKREKSRKTEFFVLASSSNDSVDIDIFGSDEKFNGFNAFDKTLAVEKHRLAPNAAANACRKLAELKQAVKLAGELESGDVIVLDRDLQATITDEKEIMDELYAKAEQKNVIICGIAKTTRLFTDTGDSAIAAVSAIAPETSWYAPVAEGHNAGIYFVKLNKASKYIFRFEIHEKQKQHIEKALWLLKQNSRDPVFLGYPYGLIEADKFARVSNEEAEYMKVRLMAKAGKNSSKILEYMKSIDAHSILDNIA